MRRPPSPARPRHPLHLGAGMALLVAGLPLSCGGCERRVEEPLPEVRPLDHPAPPPTAAAAVEHPRCVKATPAVAKRATPPSPDPRCPKDPEKPPPLRVGSVTFADPQATKITIEIAENDHDRQRGLMYRTKMGDDHGMIFSFEKKSDHAFWMHNTCIPLDMLFIDDDGLVVGIEENTPTISDDTFEVGCESKYVLEVNAGWTRAHGVMAGQWVKIDGI